MEADGLFARRLAAVPRRGNKVRLTCINAVNPHPSIVEQLSGEIVTVGVGTRRRVMRSCGWVLGFMVSAVSAVSAVSVSPIHAASFDCRLYLRSRTCPELVICSTPELSATDDRLGASYDLLMKRLPVSQALRLRDEQKF